MISKSRFSVIALLSLFIIAFVAKPASAFFCENSIPYGATLESGIIVDEIPPFTWSLSASIYDYYKAEVYVIQVYEGQTISVSLDVTSGADLDLFLLDPECGCKASSQNEAGLDEQITYTADSTGFWRVVVVSYYSIESPPFEYEIEISVSSEAPTTPTPTITPTPTPTLSTNDEYEPNDNVGQFVEIDVPIDISNLYLTSDDEDWFLICMDATAEVTIETYYPGWGDTVDTVLYLYDTYYGDNSWIDMNDDKSSTSVYSRITRTLQSGECYYIRVESVGEDYGAYGLRVSLSGTPTPTPTPTPTTSPPTTTTPQIPGQPPQEGNWFQNAIQQLQDTIGGFIQWLQENNPVQAVVDRVVQFISDVVSWFYESVADLINRVFFEPFLGVLEQISNSVMNAITSTFDAIKNAIERMIGINTTATT